MLTAIERATNYEEPALCLICNTIQTASLIIPLGDPFAK